MNSPRHSSLVTVSLPRRMLTASDRAARKQHMTRSELMRTALRHYLEGVDALDAIGSYTSEKKMGKLKVLKGSLLSLAR